MNINNKCVLKKGTHRGKLYAVLIIEAREHSTAKNHSRAPGEARGVGGGVTGSGDKFLWGCVWNVLGNFCNLIQNKMRFDINHFTTEIKIMQFKYHYMKKLIMT